MALAARILTTPHFQCGRLLMSAGVNHLVERGQLNPLPYLSRHMRCDWGDLSESDRRANQRALQHGDRLLSSYQVNPSLKIWIITEADRHATTILLPSEY